MDGCGRKDRIGWQLRGRRLRIKVPALLRPGGNLLVETLPKGAGVMSDFQLVVDVDPSCACRPGTDPMRTPINGPAQAPEEGGYTENKRRHRSPYPLCPCKHFVK